MQRFASPDEARELLQAQQSSGEALEIKRQADPRLSESRQAERVLMPTRFHKRQIRMIEIAPGVNRASWR
jgi:hypothetical protein